MIADPATCRRSRTGSLLARSGGPEQVRLSFRETAIFKTLREEAGEESLKSQALAFAPCLDVRCRMGPQRMSPWVGLDTSAVDAIVSDKLAWGSGSVLPRPRRRGRKLLCGWSRRTGGATLFPPCTWWSAYEPPRGRAGSDCSACAQRSPAPTPRQPLPRRCTVGRHAGRARPALEAEARRAVSSQQAYAHPDGAHQSTSSAPARRPSPGREGEGSGWRAAPPFSQRRQAGECCFAQPCGTRRQPPAHQRQPACQRAGGLSHQARALVYARQARASRCAPLLKSRNCARNRRILRRDQRPSGLPSAWG